MRRECGSIGGFWRGAFEPVLYHLEHPIAQGRRNGQGPQHIEYKFFDRRCGDQRRVGLARALAADPAIMLIDEPFGAIDAITRARLQGELADIQSKLRKTIIFVTHDVEEALRLADKIVIMREGTIVQYDTPLKIITQPRDTFVRDLTGADDVLRRLSLVSVRDALAAGRNGNGVVITDSAPYAEPFRSDDNLRDALARLLRAGVEVLPIVGPNGEQLGQLSLDQLRGIAQDKQTSRQEDKARVL